MLNHKIGGWGKLEKDACWIHNNFFSSLHYWAANAAQIQPFLGSISVLFFFFADPRNQDDTSSDVWVVPYLGGWWVTIGDARLSQQLQ